MDDALADAILDEWDTRRLDGATEKKARIAADVAREWMEGKAVMGGKVIEVEPCDIDCSEHYDGRHLSANERIPIDQESA